MTKLKLTKNIATAYICSTLETSDKNITKIDCNAFSSVKVLDMLRSTLKQIMHEIKKKITESLEKV